MAVHQLNNLKADSGRVTTASNVNVCRRMVVKKNDDLIATLSQDCWHLSVSLVWPLPFVWQPASLLRPIIDGYQLKVKACWERTYNEPLTAFQNAVGIRRLARGESTGGRSDGYGSGAWGGCASPACSQRSVALRVDRRSVDHAPSSLHPYTPLRLGVFALSPFQTSSLLLPPCRFPPCRSAPSRLNVRNLRILSD